MGCPDIDSCENRKSRCKNYIAGNRSYCFKPTLSLEPPRTDKEYEKARNACISDAELSANEKIERAKKNKKRAPDFSQTFLQEMDRMVKKGGI